jgi:hypothetical protein
VSWLRWESGRQKSGYDKLLLASSKRLKFDLYLLRFPRDCSVPEHRDPAVPGYEHHRINLTLKKPLHGGEIVVHGPCIRRLCGRYMRFRPDLYLHWMTSVEYIWNTSHMYVLSLGWLRKSCDTSASSAETS